MKENLDNFTREFREGMTTEHRQRLLGDFDSSAPEHWRWGGPCNDEVHILLMAFGVNKEIALNPVQFEHSHLVSIRTCFANIYIQSGPSI